MGVFGIGRYASNLNVKTLMGGSASTETHYAAITKVCQLILTRDQSSRLPRAMQLNKSIKSMNTVLDFCLTDKWIDSAPLFPSYLSLDTDRIEDLDDKPVNALHELRLHKEDIDNKLNMLEITDRPVREEFKVMNEDGTVDFDLLGALNKKEQTSHASNVKAIAESLEQLRKLGGKSIMNRNFSEVDRERTVELSADNLDLLKSSLESSIDFNKKRFATLADYRALENKHQKMLNLHEETKLNVD